MFRWVKKKDKVEEIKDVISNFKKDQEKDHIDYIKLIAVEIERLKVRMEKVEDQISSLKNKYYKLLGKEEIYDPKEENKKDFYSLNTFKI